MMGGGLDDIKLHRDNNSILIAIPFENKTVHTEENERHLMDYVTNLRQSLNQYILQQESMSHMNYKIVVLKHDKDILTGKEIILSGLSDLKSPISPISKVIENNGSLSENKYKTHFNKGALYNIAGNIAMHDSHIKNIILHPIGFIPNNHMVAHYFDNPRSSVQLLSIDTEFNGPILMNKRTFFKNSFPNHLWSDFNTNVIYEKILKQNNIPIRKFIDINAKWTQSPDLLEMDDYMHSNELVDLDSVYYEQNNIVRNQWYKTINIQTISDNSTIYDVKLDFNCNPISNIDNSFIWQIVNKNPKSRLGSGNQHNTIIHYLGTHIKYLFGENVSIENTKSNSHDNIIIIVDDDMIKLINMILRIRITISVFRALILSNYPDKLSIMRYSDFSLTINEENNIVIKLINKDSEDDELFVDINEVLKKPTVTNRVATYKFLDVKSFDYENVRETIEELLVSLKKQNIERIKPDQLARFNTIRKTIDTSKYVTIEQLGDTDIILDSKTDSIKYLNLHDQSITNSPKNETLNVLTENEFFIAMKYKLSKKLDIEDSGLIDVINSDYFEKYVNGKKVIISDKIGTITDVSLTSINVSINGTIKNISINPNDPSSSVNLLEDILLDDVDKREMTINGDDVNVIGKYINNKGEKMLVIESIDHTFKKIINYSKYLKETEKASISQTKQKLYSDDLLGKDLKTEFSLEDIRKYIDNPVDRNTKLDDKHSSRLPYFCESLSKMKPISRDIVKNKRDLIYKLILRRFDISNEMLLVKNNKELLEKISNSEFVNVLFRAYDISFFNRKYRRYTGITGCRSKICFNGKCFESNSYKDLSKNVDTILSINIDTEQIIKNIKILSKDKTIGASFSDNKFDNILKYILVIFEHELVNSFINCFCLSYKKDIRDTKVRDNMSKTIIQNLFRHSEEIHQLLIN